MCTVCQIQGVGQCSRWLTSPPSLCAGRAEQSSELEGAGEAVCHKLRVRRRDHKAVGVLWGRLCLNSFEGSLTVQGRIGNVYILFLMSGFLTKDSARERIPNSEHIHEHSLAIISALYLLLCVRFYQVDSLKMAPEFAKNDDSLSPSGDVRVSVGQSTRAGGEAEAELVDRVISSGTSGGGLGYLPRSLIYIQSFTL